MTFGVVTPLYVSRANSIATLSTVANKSKLVLGVQRSIRGKS